MNKLRADLVFTLARQCLGVGAGVVLITLLARLLGPGGNGRYALAVLLPSTLTTFLELGVATSTTFAVARGDMSVRAALAFTFRRWGAMALLGLAVGAGLIVGFRARLFPGLGQVELWTALAAFLPMLLQTMLVGILQGLEEFRAISVVTLLPTVANIGLSLGLIHLGFDPLRAALAGFAGAQWLGGAALLWLALRRRHLGKPPSGAVGTSAGAFGLAAHASNVLTFLNYRTDIYLVTLLIGNAAAGLYNIGVQLVERLWILPSSVSYVLLPRMAARYAEKVDDGGRAVSAVARAVWGVTLLAAAALALAAPVLIRGLFGQEFAQSAPVVLALLPGIVMGAYSKILSNDLAARGHVNINLVFAAGLVLLNLALNLLLLPRLGLIGAAVATSLSYTADALLKLVVLARVIPAPLLGFALGAPGEYSGLMRRAFRRSL